MDRVGKEYVAGEWGGADEEREYNKFVNNWLWKNVSVWDDVWWVELRMSVWLANEM